MPRYLLVAIFLLGCVLVGVGAWIGRPAATVKHTNVVLIVMDTFRADLIGAQRNGVPVTPFLSSLAGRSVQFKNAISPSSLTRPSMACLVTATDIYANGVYHSVESPEDKVPANIVGDDLETITEYMAANGFDPWVMQTNVNAAMEIGMAQGVPAAQYTFTSRAPAGIVTSNALRMARKAQGPFFLWAHYLDTHGPYYPPEEYLNMFGPQPQLSTEERELLSAQNFTKYLYDRLKTYTGQQAANTLPDLTPAGVEWLHLRYDASARYLDDEIADLVRGIETTWPDTVFIVVADHGEEIYERGLLGHGHSLYQELLHVPFFIAGPGLAPRTVDAHVATHSLLPTLAEALHLPARAQWQTASALTRTADTVPIFSLTKSAGADAKIYLESAIQGTTKLLWNHRTNELHRFDLAADPKELNGVLCGADDPEAQRLHKAILARHAATGGAPPVDYGGVWAKKAAPAVSAETLKQLHDLGYKSEN